MNLDLNLEILKTNNCNYLHVLDSSTYPIVPTSGTLRIYLPGYESPYVFEDFAVSELNQYNSYNFSLSTEDSLIELPDGLYKFVYDTCPSTITATTYSLRTCKIRCRLAEKWAECIQSCGEKDSLYKLDYVEFLLKGAEANAFLCNPTIATELYTKADEYLQRLENPCNS